MNRKNILISTIKDFDSHNTFKYYYHSRGRKVTFCEAMAAGEAGAKHILSRFPIDEIIAIGSTFQTDGSDVKKMVLRNGINFYTSDVNEMSDFDFFRYRLVQYIDGIDIEAADIYHNVSKDRRQVLIDILNEVYGDRLDMAYAKLTKSLDEWHRFLDAAAPITQDEMDFAKRYLFHQVDQKYRLKPSEQNEDIKISFIPISSIELDRNSMKNVSQLTNALRPGPDEEVYLYVDLHGFSHDESYILLSMLQALSDNPSNRITIQEITAISDIPKGFIYKISNARERYKVELLLSGVNAFVNYGKVDLIRRYWENTGIKNDYIDHLMYAMDAVDTGMTLCNIDELEKGIHMLRQIINQDIEMDINKEEESFILVLRAGILNDFGPLMLDDDPEIDLLELVKWVFKKGFYQQAITIIESRFPHDMVKRGILYYADTEEEKLAYMRAFNSQYWDSSQKERYIFHDPDHFFIKYYARFMSAFRTKEEDKNLEFAKIRVDQVFGPESFALKAHSLIEDPDTFEDIMYTFYDIAGLRNDINHARRDKSEQQEEEEYLGESSIKKSIRENLDRFIRKYMAVRESISEKSSSLKPILISPEELDVFTDEHGPKDDPECMSVPGYVIKKERRKAKKTKDPAE